MPFARAFGSEFVPMFPHVFRLVDDYVSHAATRNNAFNAAISQSIRTFQPRFDVKETKETYELLGELPGLNQKDINIEFTDAQTISIKGRTESQREEGSRPSALVKDNADQDKVSDTDSTNFHKASVEDESTTPGGIPEDLTPTTTVASEVAQPEQPQQPKEQSRYWVSERSVGEFARSFSFPRRVDQEHVKASLKNGILSVIIPKAQAPELKRISIE